MSGAENKEKVHWNGILNILKPPGMTSFDVVGFLRGVLKTKKIGHTGTLDPAAVGVLPVCVGSATKAIEFMTEKDKLYRAELTLGTETDTQDSTGQVIAKSEVRVTAGEIVRAVESFTGKYDQIPPMYSAVKIDGKRLYDLARSGITVDRAPRSVEIYSIKVLKVDESTGSPRVIFDVECSKGTYIRTLCADIGQRLGCGGHMSFLLRLKAGIFPISGALTLEEVSDLTAAGRLEDKIIPVGKVFADYKQLRLEAASLKKFLNGLSIDIDKNEFSAGDLASIGNDAGEFIAIGEIRQDRGRLVLKSKKQFI